MSEGWDVREAGRVVCQHAAVHVIELDEAGPLQVFGGEYGEAGGGTGAEGEVGEGGAAAVERGVPAQDVTKKHWGKGVCVLVAVEHGDGYDAPVGLVVEQATHHLIVLHVQQPQAAAVRREGSTQTVVGEDEYEAAAAQDLNDLAPLAEKRKTQTHDFSIDDVKCVADVHGPVKWFMM